MGHAVLEDVNSTVPMKVTARHLASLSLYRTYISTLPWPGIFVYNATRAAISYSILPNLYPKSISMTLGSSVDISYNIMDVDNSLNIQQFGNVNEQCNRLSKEESLSQDCKRALVRKDLREPFGRVKGIRIPEPIVPQAEEESDQELEAQPTVLEDEAEYLNFTYVVDYVKDHILYLKNDSIAVTVLAHNDAYGSVFIILGVIFIIIFSLIYCCCQCCCKKSTKEEEQLFLERQLSNHLVETNRGGKSRLDDGDEYSNSSKAHLAQGMDNNDLGGRLHRFPDAYPTYPAVVSPLRFVTVQRMQADAGEDGVICGSLTLTPSTNVNRDDGSRAVASNQLKAQAFNSV